MTPLLHIYLPLSILLQLSYVGSSKREIYDTSSVTIFPKRIENTLEVSGESGTPLP